MVQMGILIHSAIENVQTGNLKKLTSTNKSLTNCALCAVLEECGRLSCSLHEFS